MAVKNEVVYVNAPDKNKILAHHKLVQPPYAQKCMMNIIFYTCSCNERVFKVLFEENPAQFTDFSFEILP